MTLDETVGAYARDRQARILRPHLGWSVTTPANDCHRPAPAAANDFLEPNGAA